MPIITVNNVSIESKGSYKIAKVEITNDQGRNETRTVLSFKKAIYDVLSVAQPGDTFDVQQAKNDKGYWEISSAVKTAAGAGAGNPKPAAASTPRSTYETPEERAARQLYIIRQSNINSAIATVSVGAKSVKVEEVLALARKYEDYVFGKGSTGLTDLAEDGFMATDIPSVE